MKPLTIIEQWSRFDFHHLEVDTLGSWPLPLRLLVLISTAALILLGGWLLVLAGSQQQLTQARATETRLQQQYRQQASQTEQPAALEAGLARLRSQVDARLMSFPAQLDLPELIDDISRAASGAGLVIEQITPGEERQQDLLSQTPIQMVLRGGYHQLGAFVAALSTLPGHISLHRVTLSSQTSSDQTIAPDGALIVTLEARSYRQTPAGKE